MNRFLSHCLCYWVGTEELLALPYFTLWKTHLLRYCTSVLYYINDVHTEPTQDQSWSFGNVFLSVWNLEAHLYSHFVRSLVSFKHVSCLLLHKSIFNQTVTCSNLFYLVLMNALASIEKLVASALRPGMFHKLIFQQSSVEVACLAVGLFFGLSKALNIDCWEFE